METIAAVLVALLGVALIVGGYIGWAFLGSGPIRDNWSARWMLGFSVLGAALIAYVLAKAGL